MYIHAARVAVVQRAVCSPPLPHRKHNQPTARSIFFLFLNQNKQDPTGQEMDPDSGKHLSTRLASACSYQSN